MIQAKGLVLITWSGVKVPLTHKFFADSILENPTASVESFNSAKHAFPVISEAFFRILARVNKSSVEVDFLYFRQTFSFFKYSSAWVTILIILS